MMFNFQENLSADATVVKTVGYFMEAEILGHIYDKLFQNVNFSTSRVDDFYRTMFLKVVDSSYKSVLCESEFRIKFKFVQRYFHVPSDISCNLWRFYKKLKVA